ncbi:transferase family protein [Penicillium cataractarum]|uniref:Transferase family protein n=1 Tax=Penicillium cataractarum TaxID=2100454 RepID=A0A9W9SLR5_9EURO|nr:transferase family protein [Penicillium cataractarum]KAJ5379994.1 transferase family protein [Penicillium cataractarum]
MAEILKYELSDLDKGGFLKEVTVAMFYEIPPTVNSKELISSLEEGLRNALDQLPFMAGDLQFEQTGKLCIVKSPESQLKFEVHQFDSAEHKSISTMAQSSFAPDALDLTQFIPQAPENKKPVCALKLNFIEGGLVFGLRVNHASGDWSSIDKFLSLICQSCKAHQEGLKMPSFTPDLNRVPYNKPADLSNYSRQHSLESLRIFYVMEKSQFKPPSSTPSQPKIYRISDEAIKDIKDQCCPYLTGVEYISSYDCISALVWRSITRARLSLHPEKTTSPSRFIHPIDVRTRDPEHTTSEQYFGNAVIGAQAGPLDAQALVSDGSRGLATAASSIRQSINSVDLASISHMTSLVSSLSLTETLGSHADFTDMDVFMNTWHSGSTEKYDLGAGVVPVALRLHAPIPGACAVILPNFSRGSTRVFDIHLQVTAEEHELLKQDADFVKYFELVA